MSWGVSFVQAVVVAPAAVPMSAMHEKVDEWAGSQKQPGQRAENMRGMLGQQEESRDCQEAEQNNAAP